MYGYVVFRYTPQCGWQIFDWVPSRKGVMEIDYLILRDNKGVPKLLRLHGFFITTPRRGQFCKQPHKMILWPSQIQLRKAA